jgi:hypothetical protein
MYGDRNDSSNRQWSGCRYGSKSQAPVREFGVREVDTNTTLTGFGVFGSSIGSVYTPGFVHSSLTLTDHSLSPQPNIYDKATVASMKKKKQDYQQ